MPNAQKRSADAKAVFTSAVTMNPDVLVNLLQTIEDFASELRDTLGTLGVAPYASPETVEDMAWEEGMRSVDVSALPDVPDASCVKSLGANRVGGYAVLWGDAERRDLSGEWFDRNTAELTELFKELGRLPWLYKHGMDSQLRTQVVGIVDRLVEDEIGLWYEAQLSESSKYKDLVLRLVQAGKLGTSSGTLPGARKVAPSGHIDRWPIVELSGTPAPMEHRMLERPIAEVRKAFEDAGLTFSYAGRVEGAVEARDVALQLERLQIAALETWQ